MSSRQHVEIRHITVFPGESVDITLWAGRTADSESVLARVEVSEGGEFSVYADDGFHRRWDGTRPTRVKEREA